MGYTCVTGVGSPRVGPLGVLIPQQQREKSGGGSVGTRGRRRRRDEWGAVSTRCEEGNGPQNLSASLPASAWLSLALLFISASVSVVVSVVPPVSVSVPCLSLYLLSIPPASLFISVTSPSSSRALHLRAGAASPWRGGSSIQSS